MNEHDRLRARITELEADLAVMGEEVKCWDLAARFRDSPSAMASIAERLMNAKRACRARPGCVAAIEGGGGKKA